MREGKLKRPEDAPKLYSQDGKGYEATVYAHYFLGGNDWFITEYDPVNDEAFGWARLNGDTMNAELGYIPMAELEAVYIKLLGNKLMVEYDVNWKQRTLTESIKLLG